jgi:hypothetical protein
VRGLGVPQETMVPITKKQATVNKNFRIIHREYKVISTKSLNFAA